MARNHASACGRLLGISCAERGDGEVVELDRGLGLGFGRLYSFASRSGRRESLKSHPAGGGVTLPRAVGPGLPGRTDHADSMSLLLQPRCCHPRLARVSQPCELPRRVTPGELTIRGENETCMGLPRASASASSRPKSGPPRLTEAGDHRNCNVPTFDERDHRTLRPSGTNYPRRIAE